VIGCTKLVSRDGKFPVWTVGFVGPKAELSDPFGLAGAAGYEIERVTAETLGDRSLDVLLVASRSLAAGGDALVAAIEAADVALVVAVSRGEVAVPATALGAVDEHVAIDDTPDRLRSLLDEVREQRWSNLGLSPETLLDRVFETVPIHLYLKDTAARHTRTSSAGEKPYEIIGKTDREIYSNDRFTAESYQDDAHVIETGESIIEKEEHDDLKGIWTLCSKVPLENGDGDIVGLVGITKEITERKEAQTDLERQIDRLEEFASVLSHDLRNPLSVTLGRAELAHEKYPEDEHVASILRNVKRMGAIIEDVLTMTKQGRQVEEREVMSLRSVAERRWESAETADADLTVTTSRRFEGDQDRVDTLFENLFANSIEHGGDDVSVTVEALPDGDGFVVADDGPGIAPEDRDRVFEQGYSTTQTGTGLGLNIVEQVVDAHGWTITIEESEGGGARFVVTGIDRSGEAGETGESVK